MKKTYLIGLVICIVIAVALTANAYMGNQMWWGMDQPTLDAMQNERTAFFNATADLRNDIYRKNLELQAELSAKQPDTNKIKTLQKEISNLQTDLAQKSVDYELNMKKIAPNYGGGMMVGMNGNAYCQGFSFRNMMKGFHMRGGYGCGGMMR